MKLFCATIWFVLGLFPFSSIWPVFLATLFLFKPFFKGLMLGVICIFLSQNILSYHTQNKQALLGPLENFNNSYVELHGQISGLPDKRFGHVFLSIQARKICSNECLDIPERTILIRAKVNLSHGSTIYDEVVISGKLKAIEDFETQTGRMFPFQNFMLSRNTGFSLSPGRIKVVEENTKSIEYVINALSFLKKQTSRQLPSPHSGLINGMLYGDQSFLSPQLRKSLETSGLIHIVVLSGYNITLLTELTRRITLKTTQSLPLSIAMSIILTLLFIAATGFQATTVRAGIMAGLALIARWTGNDSNAINFLCITVILLIFINPLQVRYDIGFQLSALATYGIVMYTDRIAVLFKKTPGFVREAFSTTIASQLGVLSVLLVSIGNISIVGILSNVVIAPVLPISMLTGILGQLSGPLLPNITPLLNLVTYLGTSVVFWVNKISSELSFAAFTIPYSYTIEIIGVMMFILMILIHKKLFSSPPDQQR